MAIRLDDDSISMEVHGCVAAITRLRRTWRQMVTARGSSATGS
jgi:hypothetical protein